MKDHHIVLPIRTGLAGYFKVQLLDAETGKIKRELKFKNLITNVALNTLGSADASLVSLFQYCGVGTGSVLPAVTDTSLNTPIGSRINNTGGTANIGGFGPNNDYSYWRITRLFLEGEVNGNLTEVGMFSAASSGVMWTRQLFRDIAGDPVAISKTSNEQLRIEYELRVYHPVADVVNVLNLNGVDTTCTTRAISIGTDAVWGYNVGGASGIFPMLGVWSIRPDGVAYETDVMPLAIANPSGNKANRSSLTVAAYAADSFQRDVTFTWDPAVANWAGGIGGVSHGAWIQNAFFTTLSPKPLKTDTFRFRFTARYSWARI